MADDYSRGNPYGDSDDDELENLPRRPAGSDPGAAGRARAPAAATPTRSGGARCGAGAWAAGPEVGAAVAVAV